MHRYFAFVGFLGLTGCSSGPSNTDIQKALQALEKHSEIVKIDQTSCVAATEGRTRCTFKVTVKSGNWVRDRDRSALFEKQPNGWALVSE